ncbi:MAG: type VI secretion system protein TssA [Phycisphaerae bacterium]
MDAATVEQIISLGKQPISDAAPVGDPVRYEPVFEQVQQQMDKIGTIAGTGGGPDWNVVIDLSKQILQTKSKDLLVMTYLVVGLLERDGYKGLVAGLQAYEAFLTTFWEPCYPKVKPPQGRKNAVQYLIDKILDQAELREGKRKLEPEGGDKEAVHKCADVVVTLDETITKVFTGQPETPNSAPLVRAFKSLREKVGPLVTEAPPAPVAAAAAAAPSDGSAPPPMMSSAPAMMGDFKTPTQALDAVKKVAKFMLSQSDKDGSGYRLMRAACFGSVPEPPKDNLIPPPPAPRKQFFEKLAGDGNWPQLLLEAEGQFAATPLWLDCQRFVALALKNCGPMYKGAYDAVVLETVALYQRMPALFNVTYKGGIPFADGATKAWVDELAGSMGGGGGGGGRGGPADAIEAAIGEARKMLSESKTGEAVQRLSAQVDMSGSRRGQFRAQLALAELCLDLGRVNLAISMLEGLESVVDDYRVGEWEPELAAGVFRSLYSALTKAKATPTPEDKKRMDVVFGRLCRLDPATAFVVDPMAKPKA